jgi:hypothetical protein
MSISVVPPSKIENSIFSFVKKQTPETHTYILCFLEHKPNKFKLVALEYKKMKIYS